MKIKELSGLCAVVCLGAASAAFAQPTFGAQLVAGSSTAVIYGTDTNKLTFYQFAANKNPATACAKADFTSASVVTVTTSSGPSSIFTVSGSDANTVTFATPLVRDTFICIYDNTAEVGTPLQAIVDPNDYGRVRTYFIAGVQVTNQQSATTSASSTAGQYLEAGFNYTWLRAKDGNDFRYKINPAYPKDPTKRIASQGGRRTPGLSVNVDVRLSPIPVAAPATTTTATTTTTGSTPTTTTSATMSTSPNLLTSQQSARVVTSIYFPFKATRWDKHSDYFTVAPLARGGFATLLNPSVNSSASTMPTTTTTSSMTTTTSTTTTGQFNSAYSFFAYGARFGWDRYPASTDEAPQVITQFLVTLGNYSNLPSFVCRAAPTGATVTLNPNSACGVAGSSLASLPVLSRMLVPRLDIEGLAKLPNYPFVIGLDANLAQYTVYKDSGSRPIDYLNKPGNDIRIYVGFSIDLNSVISKLGVSLPK